MFCNIKLMMVKLNLGCGNDKRSGYINIDVREDVKPDLVVDLEEEFLRRFADGSVDEIFAKDFIEHLSWRLVKAFLKDCFRVLKRGGRMFIQTPDLEAICKTCVFNPNYRFGELEGFEGISFWIYGAQDYKENLHKCGFTIPTLKRLLEEIGFKVISISNDGGSNIVCWVEKPTGS